MKRGQNPFSRLWNSNRDRGVPQSLASVGTDDLHHLAFLRSMRKDVQHVPSGEMELRDLEVVVVDLETTGFHPDRGDEIFAIGAIALRGATLIPDESFYSLINPNRSIPAHICELTGITNEMVQDAPDTVTALSRFFQYAGNRLLVAHHSRHEREFFRAALWKTSRSRLTLRLLDTMMLIRLFEGPLVNTSLDALCAQHQIEITRRHHAQADAVAAAELWGLYVEKALEHGYHNLQQVYEQIVYR